MALSDWPDAGRHANGAAAADLAAQRHMEADIARRLDAMPLAAKVGQMIQGEITHITPAQAGEHAIGSVLNGGGSWPGQLKRAAPGDWLRLADAYHAASLASAAGVPLLWGTDAVHGHNNAFGATVFPHNIGLGAAGDAALIEAIGAATAKEVASTGVDWSFAPTLAVVRDNRWGRTYESYAEAPELVAAYAERMLTGLQGAVATPGFLGADKVLATAKHFIGDGGTGGVDQGDAVCSEETLRCVHGAGHIAALRAGAQVVMAAFNSWNGAKVHGHRYLLTEVLKGRLGFDGFVISDWNGCQQLAPVSRQACAQAVNAGVDMLMVDEHWRSTLADLLRSVTEGDVALARIDDAVRRILRVKHRAGLFTAPNPSARPLAGWPLGTRRHRALARRAVRESLVMLKNNDALLPLRRDMNVLVAGDHADDIGRQCGGWTLTWQGDGNGNADFPNGESILAGVRAATAAGGGATVFSPKGQFEERPDVAIVVFGEDPYAEGEGDVAHLAFSAWRPQPLAMLRDLKARGVPVVSVFVTGRPLWVNPELNASDAFVVAWLPGSEGGGVADVLFRAADGAIAHDLHGKLTFSWPRDPAQTAVNRGDEPYEPLFPYGFGLRYADGPGRADQFPEQPARPLAGAKHAPARGSGM